MWNILKSEITSHECQVFLVVLLLLFCFFLFFFLEYDFTGQFRIERVLVY